MSEHKLNKVKFLAEMEKRGWVFNDKLAVWIRPASRTQRDAEANWIDSILTAIECPQPPMSVEEKTLVALRWAHADLLETETRIAKVRNWIDDILKRFVAGPSPNPLVPQHPDCPGLPKVSSVPTPTSNNPASHAAAPDAGG